MSATDSVHSGPKAASPAPDRDRIARLVCGHMATRVVGAAASLGIADLLGDAERPAAEIAEAAGCHPGATERLLRALTALELVTECRPGHFRLTPTGTLLRTDHPGSMHSFAGMCTDAAMLDAWRDLDTAVRTGRSVFADVFGTDFFGHLANDPALSERFNAAMRQGTRLAARALPMAYDFGRFSTVTDVGGGDGTLLAAILRTHPGLHGVLCDSAAGLAQAEPTLSAAGVADRCTTRECDFFREVPAGSDAYLLKSILHDWDDERAELILRNCRAAMGEQGRLLIIEPVLPAVVDPSSELAYLSDLNMLVNLGGRERTRDDFSALCASAGFELADVVSLAPARFSLIEAVPFRR
ncbi:methyltransferase [Streptomyces sp. NPDC085927]|uniref:methyltransferase n=1 Tax=Streptomyces sp. NPDC085927 TaxID=3365738 RepID=UPI0037D7CB62